MNALVDDGNNSTSPNSNKQLNEDEISDQLLHVPTGHHYLVLYPDIETMRKVYASYNLILLFFFFRTMIQRTQ